MDNYEKFFQLHHQAKPLIIANAWNVKSAQIIESSGYNAIATSSGAIANSLGYPDGEKIRFSELLYVIQRIKSCTNIPLSVDLERGYTDDLTELNDHVQKLVDIGVSGINLEDAQGEEIYLKKLYSVKNYLTKNNGKLFINARCDAFLQHLDSPLEKTMKRAKLYEEAGADGLFVTGIEDLALVREITSSVTLPVNVVGVPKLSSIEALTAAGVRRISMAVFLYKETYNHLEKVVRAVQTAQSFNALFGV
jgi:2-methylisocitrate lyase-like PEP mutase family enzyme